MSEKPTYVELEQRVMELERVESERRQTEEALRNSLDVLDATQKIAKIGGWVWDVENQTMTWTDETYRIHGLRPGEVEACSPEHVDLSISCYDPDDRPRIKEAFLRCVNEGIPYDLEFPFTTVNGHRRWIQTLAQPVFDGKRVIRVIGNIMDITDRKRAEEALRYSEKFLRQVIDASPNCIFIKDRHGRYVLVNNAIANLYGVSKEEMLGRTDFDLTGEGSLDPKEAKKFLADDQDVINSETVKSISEEVFTRGDGTQNWFHTIKVPLSSDLMPNCMLGVATDITERKHTEETLEAQREQLRSLFDYSGEAIVLLDIENHILEMNSGFERIFGYSSEEARGKVIDDLICPERFRDTEAKDLDKKAIAGIKGVEIIRKRKDGQEIDVRTSAGPIKIRDNVTGRFVIFDDITERKRSEEALLESERRFQKMLGVVPDMISIHSPEMDILYSNWQGFAAVPENKRILNTKCHKTYRGLDALCPDCRAKTVLETRKPIQEEMMLPDGTWVDLRIIPLLDEKNNVQMFMEWVRDITVQKRAEEKHKKLESQLAQARKMESVGRLAGGVAHDFNNMLGVIIGHTELALDTLSQDAPLFNDLTEIRKAAKRSSELTRQLLGYARRQTISPKVLDLNETVEKMLKMLRRLIGEEIDLSWHPGKFLWPVNMDPTQLDQVLANLCVNARDAIRGVGKVTIETANVTLDENYCADRAGFKPGNYVMLAVSDDGCGIEKEILSNLFDPFFTTKDVGKGTGLGLATVYGIVKQNDGYINVYSEPGEGTTFRIYMPQHMKEPADMQVRSRVFSPLEGNETVLLVEDEPTLLKMGKAMLERLGYRVLAAGAPSEALELAGACEDTIDLLMTDVVMPEMNGKELSSELENRCPGIKTLFMSGYTANVIAHHGVLDSGVSFIQKPFSMEDLSVKVKEALS